MWMWPEASMAKSVLATSLAGLTEDSSSVEKAHDPLAFVA